MQVHFVSQLNVKHIVGTNLWSICSPLKVIVTEIIAEAGAGDRENVIHFEVPVGFITDFCSVPNVPVISELFSDRTIHGYEAGAFHDWLYADANYPREWCDRALKAGLLDCGVDEIKAQIMYEGVVKFGGPHYGRGN